MPARYFEAADGERPGKGDRVGRLLPPSRVRLHALTDRFRVGRAHGERSRRDDDHLGTIAAILELRAGLLGLGRGVRREQGERGGKDDGTDHGDLVG